MKKTTMILLLLVFCWSVSAFRCGRCDPPRCYETVECDSTGQNCHTVRHHRFFVSSDLNFSASDFSEGAAILDLAKPWMPDSGTSPQLTIKFQNNTGAAEQSFAGTLVPSTVPRVDREIIPWVFMFENPTAVSNFYSSSSAAGFSSSSETVTISYTITQTDCQAPSGKYINHLRQMDSTGITYDSSFIFDYTAPADGSCNNGTMVIGN